ncbi:MAG: hypothetical protein ACR2RF_25515 [Geminicoccaceae bacterium]
MDTSEAAKHAHQMARAFRAFEHAEEVLKAASEVEGNLRSVQARIAEEQATLDSLKGRNSTARRTLKSLEKQIEEAQGEFDAKARKRTADLQAKLNQMSQQARMEIDALKATAGAEELQLKADIKRKKRELADLNNQVQSAASSLGTLRNQLSGLKLAAG